MFQNNQSRPYSVLGSLRQVVPARAVSLREAERIAELQANRLLALFDIVEGPVPSEIVGELRRVQVVYEDLPVSGTSHWNGTHWIITLNKREASVRQRFTLMHEFKHIIDHGRAELLYTGDRRYTAAEQAELVADYFAACVLMPKRALKAVWSSGIQTPLKVGRAFQVSTMAAEVRLARTGLNKARDRISEPTLKRFARGRQPFYQRQLARQGASS